MLALLFGAIFVASFAIPAEKQDISGVWKGDAEWHNREFSCAYKGKFILNLQQNDDKFTGTWQVQVTELTRGPNPAIKEVCFEPGTYPAINIDGAVSDSNFWYILSPPLKIKFEGSFANDMMEAIAKDCVNRCPQGAGEILGSISGHKSD